MTHGLQIGLAFDAPEPVQAGQTQRDAERDRSLDFIAAVRADLIALAEPIAVELAERFGSVTAPEILIALRARGYGEMLDAIDSRWVAAVCLPSKGWTSIGYVNHGSKSRPVKRWVRRA